MIPVVKLLPDGARAYYDYAVRPPACIWVETPTHELHLNIPEVLRALDLADTEENRDLAVEQALAAARTAFPGVPMSVES
jgi:hypothetical protein